MDYLIDLSSSEDEEQECLSFRDVMKNDIIELLSDDEDDDFATVALFGASKSVVSGKENREIKMSNERNNVGKKLKADRISSRAKSNRRIGKKCNNSPEVVVMEAAPFRTLKTADINNSINEMCVITSYRGDNALADYPHSRADCVVFPFVRDPKKKCSNCFCFVCDIVATECVEWSRHCKASYSSSNWQREREKNRETRGSTAADR